MVSGKADRAVNRGPNTEQININKNSAAFSDRLCAKQQMQPAVSARLCAGMHSKFPRLPELVAPGHDIRPGWSGRIEPDTIDLL